MDWSAFSAFDLNVFKWFDTYFLGNAFFDKLMQIVSLLGEDGIFFIIIAIVMIIFKKTRKYGFLLAGALLVMVITNNVVLKSIFDRPRPFNYYDALSGYIYPNLDLCGMPDSASFPSGHTSAAFAAATALIYWNRKAGIPAMIFACLMGISRIYLHVHYCTDVLAGMVVGIIYGVIGIVLASLIYNKVTAHIQKKKATVQAVPDENKTTEQTVPDEQ